LANPQKSKGDAYERELATYLNEQVFGEEQCQRAPLSGGGKSGIVIAGGADLVGTPDVFIEAKRVERLNVRDAMRQAERNIDRSSTSDVPVVITRRNREATGDSLVVMRMKDWKKLYRQFLLFNGKIKDEPHVVSR
jgi:Holliday junction resolvase